MEDDLTKTTVPSGEDNIKFSYSNENADGEVIWTNTRDNNVDVTITVAETIDMKQFKLQYKKDSEANWHDDIASGEKVPFTANGVLYARLVDRTIEGEAENGETTYATANVTKIDNVEPTVSKQLAVVADSTTTNSIKVSITIQDKKSENAPETETVSGLDKVIWYYKKSTETKYQSQESSIGETNKTGVTQGLTTPLSPFIEFRDLTSGTYNIYAEVYDVAGNMTRCPKSGTTDVTTLAYTVSYDANGGTGAPASQPKIQGTDLTLSKTTPTRDGYDFKGWATSSSSSTVMFPAGGKYSTDKSVTLYAVWEIKTLTFSNGSVLKLDTTKTSSTNIISKVTFPANVEVKIKETGYFGGGSGNFSVCALINNDGGDSGTSTGRNSFSSGGLDKSYTFTVPKDYTMVFNCQRTSTAQGYVQIEVVSIKDVSSGEYYEIQ